jgi:dTDP-4-dehydrorhamnose reductase
MSYLVFGAPGGWIAQKLIELLKAEGATVHAAKSRMEDRSAVLKELEEIKPKYVLNAAGKTGRPNVDWCEDHQQETIRSNVIGTLNLADCCYLKGIHLTNYATGCIYEYDDKHPLGSGKGFTEEDKPNFAGSFYARTKAQVESLLKSYPNVLTLRVRMPISDDLHPRNFVTKIVHYEKVVDVPNSMTVLHDMLPVSIEMTKRELKGVYNFCNPGVVSHNQILALYKKYVDPDYTWVNFSLDEQAKILKAGRSNNELDCSKLLKEFPKIPHILDSMELVFQRMAKIEGRRQTKRPKQSQ